MTFTTTLAFTAAIAALAGAAHSRLTGKENWRSLAVFGIGVLLLGISKLAEQRGATYAETLSWGGLAVMLLGNWLFWQDRKRDAAPGGPA